MIEVKWGYQGQPSRERYIPAGVYAEDDPRLFGLAEYLVENGHAVRVTPEPQPEPAPVVEATDPKALVPGGEPEPEPEEEQHKRPARRRRSSKKDAK